jgi:nucleoside-diphosphate-sugar epimerase
VGDLTRAILLASEKGRGGHLYQIATQTETSISMVAETVRKEMRDLFSRDVEIRYLQFRKGEVRRSYADTRKATETLGWNPQCRVEDGIRELILWYAGRLDREKRG